MIAIRHIPHDGPRVESGPVQFGDDWPGVFLRGDHAMWAAMTIDSIAQFAKQHPVDPHMSLMLAQLHSVANDLRSCDVRALEGDTCVHSHT